MDIWTAEKRSEVMSKIKGRGNRSTELTLAKLFKERGVTGWRRHLKLPGRPDFAFKREKVAVFVDGCFWHGCPHGHKRPTSNTAYWTQKVASNQRRDRRADRELRKRGWSVIRVWECMLRRHPNRQLNRICSKLKERR